MPVLTKTIGPIDSAAYAEAVRAQSGACVVCGREPTKTGLSIDVSEKGRFRGLLCSLCMSGIGFFDGSATRLDAAAAYMRGNDAVEHDNVPDPPLPESPVG